MIIRKLDKEETALLIDVLKSAEFEVLAGFDGVDGAFKFKIDGGIWTPPLGRSEGVPR